MLSYFYFYKRAGKSKWMTWFMSEAFAHYKALIMTRQHDPLPAIILQAFNIHTRGLAHTQRLQGAPITRKSNFPEVGEKAKRLI